MTVWVLFVFVLQSGVGLLSAPEAASDSDIEKLAVILKLDVKLLASSPQPQALVAFFYLAAQIVHLSAIPARCCVVSISSQLPVGAGLGSSAAFSAAAATVLLTAFGLISTREELVQSCGNKS